MPAIQQIIQVFATIFVITTSLAGTCALVVAYIRYTEYRSEKQKSEKPI